LVYNLERKADPRVDAFALRVDGFCGGAFMMEVACCAPREARSSHKQAGVCGRRSVSGEGVKRIDAPFPWAHLAPLPGPSVPFPAEAVPQAPPHLLQR
jgi:hypothetical protein